MNSNGLRWAVRIFLVAIMAALLLYGRFAGPSLSGDPVVWGLILAGAAATAFLIWQSRWR